MEKKIVLALLPLLFFSCSEVPSAFLVLRGNYHSQQGHYQHAEVNYLQALDRELHRELVHYNQGNIYYSLGETESASLAWDQAQTLDDQDLQFRLLFNRGVLLYDQGEYQQAYERFKEALKIQPGSVDAKINLELALARIGGNSQPEEDTPREEENLLDDTQRLLYYMEQKEQEQWSGAMEEPQRAPEDW